MKNNKEIVGLIPAGGVASRLSPLPLSKELFPVGFYEVNGEKKPKPVCVNLLERMKEANIKNVYFILKNGKWDIPSYFGDGKWMDMNIAYLMLGESHGVPFTLNQAYPFVKNKNIAMGFPDILFSPFNAYEKLLSKFSESDAEIILGLFPVKNPHKWDMVDFTGNAIIQKIDLKPEKSHLLYTWIIAVWSPVFTAFMYNSIKENKNDHLSNDKKEVFISEIIQLAIENGIGVEGVIFPNGDCIDIGTTEDLLAVLKNRI